MRQSMRRRRIEIENGKGKGVFVWWIGLLRNGQAPIEGEEGEGDRKL